MMGDFNAVIHAEDRYFRHSKTASSIDGTFRRWAIESGLIDIGFRGLRYTWSGGLARVELIACS